MAFGFSAKPIRQPIQHITGASLYPFCGIREPSALSNSDDDLMRMFNSAFNRYTKSSLDLYPERSDMRSRMKRPHL